jgi:hypothetical protein
MRTRLPCKEFYVDEVFVYESRDEVVAQINYRAYAVHQFVISQTVSSLVDRYNGMTGADAANAHTHRAMVSQFLGETWSNYHDSTGIEGVPSIVGS